MKISFMLDYFSKIIKTSETSNCLTKELFKVKKKIEINPNWEKIIK